MPITSSTPDDSFLSPNSYLISTANTSAAMFGSNGRKYRMKKKL